jgi:soluble lytic murein transglycosylase-like protein
MRKWIAATIVVFGALATASAAELAVLQNGFTIRHERHVVQGEFTRLYTGASAKEFIDIPTAQITSYAPDDTPASLPETAPAIALAAAQPQKQVPQQKPVDVNALMQGAGAKHGLDPDFIASVVHAESGFNARAVSPKGAQGLMQLMPNTAAQLGVKDSFDAEANVDAGTKYLRALLDQYNGDVHKALAAYNAGSHRVDQYHGIPPYRETQAYVRRIVLEYNRKKAAEKKAATKTQASAKKPASTTSSQ